MDPNANTLGIFTQKVPRMACPNCDATLDVSEFGIFEDIECPSCGHTIKVPAILGNFVLLDELGRGAMGCVYLAQDETLGRMVALKVMRKEYGQDPKMLETLQREAQAMAHLNHPNVVQVYSFGRESEQPYLVMELLSGERLDEMIEDGNTVEEVRLLEIMRDVSMGLEAASSGGMTHGDIKPANILMNEDGRAKVVDFGLARFMDPDAEIEVWGTPYYIAPEKARKKGEDARSDQYSLGATMFHALAGKPPYDGENPTKVVVAALKEETPHISEYNEELTPQTDAVLYRMMEKNPNRRYPTYASLLADIDVALVAARERAESLRVAELMEENKRKKKPNMLVPIMMTVLVLSLCGGAAVYFLQSRSQRSANVSYAGPQRELHAPLTRVEERNMSEAVQGLRQNNFALVEEKLVTAARHIPDEHAARAWFRFMTAGIMMYAQYPDRARAYLQEAANQDPIIFDGGKVPPEDPRLLAKFALGEVSARDVQKRSRKAQLYYSHMAQLALGYRKFLEGDMNGAARFFQSYSEFRPSGVSWPYLLQPIAGDMHLSRPQMKALELKPSSTPTPRPTPKPRSTPTPRPTQTQAKATATPRPSGNSGVKTAEGRPVFQVQRVDNSGRPEGEAREPTWTRIESGMATWLAANEVLTQSRGLMPKEDSVFSVYGIFRTPSEDKLKDGEEIGLMHIGGGTQQTPEGLNVLLRNPKGSDGLQLRIKVGDGQKELGDKSIKLPEDIGLGTVFLLGLHWDGQHLTPVINGKATEPLSIADVESEDPTVYIGGARNQQGRRESPEGLEVLRAFVMDHTPEPEGILENYQKRIDNWNQQGQ